PDDRILLAQLTDLHIGAGVGDADPARRVERVVSAIAALDPAPDAVVVSGDLTQLGEPAQYARVRELLADIDPGPRDYLQYETRVKGLRLLVCDTIIPGEDGGRLCSKRIGWLEEALAADRTTPT